MSEPPDRRTVIGPYRVDLWRGFWWFRSEVVVWKDVWPALGGLIGRIRCHNEEADAVYEAKVEEVVEVTGLAVSASSRTDWVKR